MSSFFKCLTDFFCLLFCRWENY